MVFHCARRGLERIGGYGLDFKNQNYLHVSSFKHKTSIALPSQLAIVSSVCSSWIFSHANMPKWFKTLSFWHTTGWVTNSPRRMFQLIIDCLDGDHHPSWVFTTSLKHPPANKASCEILSNLLTKSSSTGHFNRTRWHFTRRWTWKWVWLL